MGDNNKIYNFNSFDSFKILPGQPESCLNILQRESMAYTPDAPRWRTRKNDVNNLYIMTIWLY
jgi:hypothetical protein